MAQVPRLLILTPDFPPARGGIQTSAHRLALGMTGFDTKVVALDTSGSDAFDATSGLAMRRVRTFQRLGAGRNVPLNAVAVLEALRFRPHLTLSEHIVTIPAAVSIRGLLGAPTAQHFHAKEIGAKPRLAAYAARRADLAIAVSRYTAGLITATGAQATRIRLISQGVDLPSDPQPLHVERPTLLTIARLEDRYKGHDVLMRALVLVRAKVPAVEWVVIGDGPLRAELEQLACSHGVADSVRFLGSVSDEERNLWLRRADLLAMPSRLPGGSLAGEGFGIVYLEAAAYGKPVVAGNVGGALDAVADGESGLLVDPTDPTAVADAVATLLLDRELALRLGRAGAERAQGFAWQVTAKRVEGVLLELLEESLRLGSLRRRRQRDSAPTGA